MEHQHRQRQASILNTLLRLHEDSNADGALHTLIDTLSNAIDDALVITDNRFTILHTNFSAQQLFGYQTPELVTKHLSVLFTASQWGDYEKACLAHLSQPDQLSSDLRQTITVTNKNRGESAAVVRVQSLSADHESIFVFRFRATKHRDNPQPNSRIQTLGRLTAGLAHEYNNLLTSIVGYSDILKMRLNHDKALSHYIDHISRASNRAADLTRHVMAFSGHGSDQPEMCELNAIISDMEKLIGGLFEENTDLVFQFAPNPVMVWIDLGTLLQILIIVILTVRGAVTQGGRVTIAIHNHPVRPDPISGSSENTGGESVNIAVGYRLQTAIGNVDQHDATPLEQDDFREDLEVVESLVRQVGGEIKIVHESETEKTYNIYLPVAHHYPAREGTKNVVHGSAPDIGTILIVDDEDMLRALMREALQTEGYQVLEASRATEALDISRQFESTIHLLVSDVVMPGMNGQELADQLLAERPHLKLLFISGHSPNLLISSGIDRLEGRFLQKPFSTSILIEKVRSALAHPAPFSLSSKTSGET